MGKAMRQMLDMTRRSDRAAGEACQGSGLDETAPPPRVPNDTGPGLLDAVLARENLQRALKQVRANKGAAGVDGLDIDQTARMLREAWPDIRDRLLKGTYRPMPVRRVMIPKPGGGERELGIPTVLDRLIQQALLQVLQPILDPTFSQHSYGFRPEGRAKSLSRPTNLSTVISIKSWPHFRTGCTTHIDVWQARRCGPVRRPKLWDLM